MGLTYLRVLGLLLLGYALLGHRVGYLGFPPLYVGEIVLALGGMLFLSRGLIFSQLREIPLIRLLAVFVAWNVICTVPYYPQYGILAIRDAAIYYYSAFAVIVAAMMMANPALFRYTLALYRKFALAYPALICVLLVLTFVGLGIGRPKAGNIAVHLAGVLAFSLLYRKSIGAYWWIAFVLTVLMIYPGRGGMLALATSFLTFAIIGLLTGMRAVSVRVFVPVLIIGAALFIMLSFDLSLAIGRQNVSAEQVITRFTSIWDREGREVSGTAKWRLDWWEHIASRTLYGGPYFWTGEGYGANLTSQVGYISEDATWTDFSKPAPLRSPHNGHLTILARSGVPGLVLWIVVQIAWGVVMIRNLLAARRNLHNAWAGVFIWSFAHWIAFLINGAFDVYLESPMGSIWLWTVYGLGLSSVWLYRQHPRLLDKPLPKILWVDAHVMNRRGG